MSVNFGHVHSRTLTNLVLGTVIVSLLFLGVRRLVYLGDQPAPSNLSIWLAFGILGMSVVTLFRVNVLRQPSEKALEFILVACFVLVGLVNWFSPDPSCVMWVLPILAASYWMPLVLQARLALLATLAIQGIAWVQLEFVGQTAIVFGWSAVAIFGIVGFAEYSRWARAVGAGKLAGVEQGKTLFLATVSHELRTPLHGVSAALDHIKANKDRPEQFEDQLKAAIRSCENATSLVNDLLDHQQLVHDDLTLNLKPQLINHLSVTWPVS